MTKRSALSAALLSVLAIALAVPPAGAQSGSSSRDKIEQPEKVMEATGVKPGMVIGEIGAGNGYFTFWLARGVGETGKVYANDIDSSALAAIERTRREREGRQRRDDPGHRGGSPASGGRPRHGLHGQRLPRSGPARRASGQPPAGPQAGRDRRHHGPGPGQVLGFGGPLLYSRKVEEIVGRSVFEIDRVETFLRDHNLYILKARKPA